MIAPPRAAFCGFVAVTMTAVVVTLGSPSYAEPRRLLIADSAAGPFRDNLTSPLFWGLGPLVPRDRASRTFYVQNNSEQTARTTVRVVNWGSRSAFEDALTFDITVGGTWTGGTMPLTGSGGCSIAVTGPSIAPGAVQAVDIGLAAGDLPGRVGMNQAATLDLAVTLTQAGAGGQVDVCGVQAAAEPEADEGIIGSDPAADCDRDVIVTAIGTPTCVPTAVDAGAAYGSGDPRSPGAIAGIAALMVATGSLLLLAIRRRRQDDPTA